MKKIVTLCTILLVSIPIRVSMGEEFSQISYSGDMMKLLDCDKEKNNDRISLACNIYFEARSELPEGQWAVAFVTRNRVKSKLFPNTYSEVVWDIKRNKKTHKRVAQFSWVLDGKPDKIRDRDAWKIAWNISGIILADKLEVRDLTNGALWYHANYIKPKWHDMYIRVAFIGKHIFYR